MKAEVKLKPTRIRVPKYGNALMLAMEVIARSNTWIRKVHQNDETFDIEVGVSSAIAQDFKKYINANL